MLIIIPNFFMNKLVFKKSCYSNNDLLNSCIKDTLYRGKRLFLVQIRENKHGHLIFI